MDDRFESWAREQIGKLREEARACETKAAHLEEVLAQFLATNPSSKRRRINAASEAEITPSPQPLDLPRRRASKNDVLYDAFAAAGSAGLSMDQIEQEAKRLGINPNRNNLRAFCWTAKNAGRLISIAPGRYAIAQKNEAAAPTPVDIAAASETHAQAREAGAGGGT